MRPKSAAINAIWFYLILVGVIVAAYSGTMDAVTKASFESAKNAVTLALSLIGAMALWLGVMKVAQAAGLTDIIAKAIRPLMVRLFPAVPSDHPAMSAMILNMAANMLGLGNAATPFGIKAMTELDRLNPEKGTATDAMCLFLAINTSSVTLLPLGVIAVRAAAGAARPALILVPGLIATLCSTTAAIVAVKVLSRRQLEKHLATSPAANEAENQTTLPIEEGSLATVGIATKIALWIALLLFIGSIPYHYISHGTLPVISMGLVTKGTEWLIPALLSGLLFFGFYRGVRVYEVATEGAKEGFSVAIRIIPFMVAVFVAIGIFRASGALELLTKIVSPLLSRFGMPAEVLPLALLRPLSGTGSFAVMSEIVARSPDSFASFVASVMQGSTETTFYVIAVYFGAVGIKRIRYALGAALIADAVGIISSVAVSHLFFRMV